MTIIKELSEKISDEITDAREYVKAAIDNRAEYPDLAKTLYTISEQEMTHMGMLHDAVTDIIRRYAQEKGEPPAPMKAVYDYLHKQQIEAAAEVKALQALYSGR